MTSPQISVGVMAPYAPDVITSAEALAKFAAILEEGGADSVWAVEHVVEAEAYEKLYPYSSTGEMPGRFVPMADPLEVLSFMAARTTTLKLGTAVMVAPLHSAAVLAKRAATLDRLSGGRLLLGLGIGWQKEEYAAVGVPYADRGERLRETIEAMRELWANHPASYAGQFVRFDRVHSLPAPTGGRVPILLGGNSPAAVRRCARMADGWFPYAIPPDEFAASVALLRTSLREAGRSPGDVPITAWPGSADRSREFDVEWARPYVEEGAARLVISARVVYPEQLGDFRDQLLRYRETVLDKLAP